MEESRDLSAIELSAIQSFPVRFSPIYCQRWLFIPKPFTDYVLILDILVDYKEDFNSVLGIMEFRV